MQVYPCTRTQYDLFLYLFFALKISYIEEKARPGTVLFFRTQSPRHFEGGDWDQGGSCARSQPLSPQEVNSHYHLHLAPSISTFNHMHIIITKVPNLSMKDLNIVLMQHIQVEKFFSVENNGTNVETRFVNEHLYEAIKGTAFLLLDVTRMSEFRADAHPSSAGGKKHDDCMHWCLPGITDTWNDLFVAHLSSIKVRN